MSPGSAEALPGDAGVVFMFCCRYLMAEGALRPPLFVSHHPTVMGGPEGQEPRVWFLHPGVFWHFPCLERVGTLHGVSVDSLGICAVEIGRICAPDRRRCRQEAPKRYLTTPAWFLM
jgi:hypothetical protein